jgi:hypothetical protein
MKENKVVIDIDGSKGIIDVNSIKSVTMMEHRDGGYHSISIYLNRLTSVSMRDGDPNPSSHPHIDHEKLMYTSKDYKIIQNTYDDILNKMTVLKNKQEGK